MSKGLVGIERDVVLNSIITDKSPLMLQSVDKMHEEAGMLTLQFNDYRIYSQGILFFKKVLPQWTSYEQITKMSLQLNVSFYYRGRGLYFISTLKKVQNGFALIVPPIVNKMSLELEEDDDCVSAKIFQPGFAGVHAYCREKSNYLLFENKLWLNFIQDELIQAKEFLLRFANLEMVYPSDSIVSLLEKEKLVLYVPDKKIPTRNFFPYPISIVQDTIEHLTLSSVNSEVQEATYAAYIPFCESPLDDVHTVFGLRARMVVISPMEVLETVLMIPICRYLVQDHIIEHKESLGSAHLSILCVTDSKIIFGCPLKTSKLFNIKKTIDQQDFPLVNGQEYSLQLRVPSEGFTRNITMNIKVSQVFKNEGRAACALCSYINLQEEDRRFLYEKFNKTKCK